MKKGKKVAATAVGAFGTSEKPGFINVNGKMVPISEIRANFDSVLKEAHGLPEGKQKSNLLNAIEGAYLNSLTWLQRSFGGAAIEA